MLILAIDSSAVCASAAILEDGKILGEFFMNTKQTHSETLMPMICEVLEFTKKNIRDVDILAVSNGPGSFTGIRIGVSAVKGLAMSDNKQCVGVSTLEAIAYNGIFLEESIICAVMDARCRQVYNALFEIKNGQAVRLCEDRAIAIDELKEECKSYKSRLVLIGDGAKLCYEDFKEFGARIINESLLYQKASSVAFVAYKLINENLTVPPQELVPMYLRLPQAERELQNKKENK